MAKGHKSKNYDVKEYDYWVNKFIEQSERYNRTIPEPQLKDYGLPYYVWYIENCPDKNVTSWAKFVDWCGFFNRRGSSKEKASKLILQKASQYDRPLMYDDFRNTGCYEVPLNYIRTHWGTMNKMKENLGLEIIQESMIDKVLTKELFDEKISNIIEICNEKYDGIITDRILDESDDFDCSSSQLRKYCYKYYNMALNDYFKQCGLLPGNAGCGLIFEFDDGEKTKSQYEYLFTKLLRKNGFRFNIDYKRDVQYKTFSKCEKMLNCDYVIFYNDRIIYIEIPGIIEKYKEWYYGNRKITASNHKDKYRIKLKEKEQLLIESGVEYYLLFPSDLTQENLDAILNQEDRIKEKIESEHRHNIDWDGVLEVGELIYTDELNKHHNKKILYNYEQKEAI